jgi:hypothetical protein
MKTCLIMIALAPLFVSAAEAGCRPAGPLVQPGDGREQECITTSDGKGQPYIDGRDQRRWRQMEQRRMDFRRAQQEGRNSWANNGTPSRIGTISPFVPGSTQDLAWRAERKRHGVQ